MMNFKRDDLRAITRLTPINATQRVVITDKNVKKENNSFFKLLSENQFVLSIHYREFHLGNVLRILNIFYAISDIYFSNQSTR